MGYQTLSTNIEAKEKFIGGPSEYENEECKNQFSKKTKKKYMYICGHVSRNIKI